MKNKNEKVSVSKIYQDMVETIKIYREREKRLSKGKFYGDMDRSVIYGNLVAELTVWARGLKESKELN